MLGQEVRGLTGSVVPLVTRNFVLWCDEKDPVVGGGGEIARRGALTAEREEPQIILCPLGGNLFVKIQLAQCSHCLR